MRIKLKSLVWLLAGTLAPATILTQPVEAAGPRRSETSANANESRDRENSVDPSRIEELIVEHTNKFRQANGRLPVKQSDALASAARDLADAMVRTGQVGQQADGRSHVERAEAHGYQSPFVSENIAWHDSATGFDSEELAGRIFQTWDRSSPHRKNILDCGMTETAVAVARDRETGRLYAVQMFGQPDPDEIRFQVTNQTESVAQYQIGASSYSLQPGRANIHSGTGRVELSLLSESGSRKGRTFQPKSSEHYVIKKSLFGVKFDRQ